MRRMSSPNASSFSFGPGPLSTTMKALIGAQRGRLLHPVGCSAGHRYVGARPVSRRRKLLDLAARYVHVLARRAVSHPVQHAGSVDVRNRARADLGDEELLAFLLRDRDRRRNSHRAVFAAALCGIAAAIWIERNRRVGRYLRASASLRPLLPGSPDLHVLAVPHPGEDFCDDHGRDGILRVDRRFQRGASRTPHILAGLSLRTCTSKERVSIHSASSNTGTSGGRSTGAARDSTCTPAGDPETGIGECTNVLRTPSVSTRRRLRPSADGREEVRPESLP